MKKENLGKRVDLVTIKMVREKSLFYSKRRFSSPNDVQEFCRLFLENEDREKLIVISLDIKNQPISVNVASVGTLNSSLAHPREIFKTAILSNAASIIIAHNHPSGDVTPSKEDVNITLRLKEAGNILGIELVDHIIIGCEKKFSSLKEKDVI